MIFPTTIELTWEASTPLLSRADLEAHSTISVGVWGARLPWKVPNAVRLAP